MSLVRVWTNIGQKKPKALLARIFSSAEGPLYTIRYLSSVSEDDKSRTIFRYEDDTYEVDDDSIAEWLGTDDVEDLGYVLTSEGSWVKGEDSDSDYVPEDEDEEDEEDEEDDVEDEEEEPVEDEEEEEENDDYE